MGKYLGISLQQYVTGSSVGAQQQAVADFTGARPKHWEATCCLSCSHQRGAIGELVIADDMGRIWTGAQVWFEHPGKPLPDIDNFIDVKTPENPQGRIRWSRHCSEDWLYVVATFPRVELATHDEHGQQYRRDGRAVALHHKCPKTLFLWGAIWGRDLKAAGSVLPHELSFELYEQYRILEVAA